MSDMIQLLTKQRYENVFFNKHMKFSICLSQVLLIDATTDEILFEIDASTIGQCIYLRATCDVNYKLLKNNIYIPCFEELFVLEAYNTRLYTKLTMELCARENNETIVIFINGLFLTSDSISIQSDYDWNTIPIRKYNIIHDFDVFINNQQLNPICIDKIIINNKKAILNSFWIGLKNCDNNKICSESIPAVLSWPICKTEIIGQNTVLTDKDDEG